jgi:GntR family transcriptional regulator / MocR family aminotransferase
MLRGQALRRAMAGRTLLYSTVYGEPCTIQARADGALVGRAGYANEDRDSGRWWIEGDRWFRQWHSWAYGEGRWPARRHGSHRSREQGAGRGV